MINTKNLLYQLQRNGGFSVSPRNGDVPLTGYMVSIPNYETVIYRTLLSANTLNSILAIYAPLAVKNNMFIGAWVDNDKVYFDLSQNIKDYNDALNTAWANNQLAIYDLINGQSIYLNDLPNSA